MAEESYEEMATRLTAANEEHLADFTNDLILKEKMGKKKAHGHAERLRFFGNDYLLNYESEDLVEGMLSFASFAGDWFIRKCMWSDVRSVKENIPRAVVDDHLAHPGTFHHCVERAEVLPYSSKRSSASHSGSL